MATSDSEDFESADEDFDAGNKSTVKSELKADPEKDEGLGRSPSLAPAVVDQSSPQASLPADSEDSTAPGDIACSYTQAEPKSSDAETIPAPESLPPQDAKEKESPQPVLETAKASDNNEPRTAKKRPERKPRESKISQQSKLGAKKLGSRVQTPQKCDISPTDVCLQRSDDVCTEDTKIEDISLAPEPQEKVVTPQEESTAQVREDSSSQRELSSVFDRLSTTTDTKESAAPAGGGWGGWGGWSSSLLSTATAGVSTFTSHVTQGINTVLETVEGGLGAPDPTELARQDLETARIACAVKEPVPPEAELEAAAQDSPEEGEHQEGGLFSPLQGLLRGTAVAEVSQLGLTGAKALSGGLIDTLETIGKKTMQVLQDGDPGLKKKRAFISQLHPGEDSGPVLSQVLREARDLAEEEAKLVEEKRAARRVHFETLFDDYQGLIHLEALEMLSRQCTLRLQSALLEQAGPALQATQAALQRLREESILPDPEDDMPEGHPDTPQGLEEALTPAFQALPVPVSPERLLKVWREVYSHASGDSETTLSLAHEQAINSLAQLTATCVEQFHRVGELLLVHTARQPLSEAAQLLQITLLECSLVEQLSSALGESLLKNHGEPAQPIITKVFLEASNSSTYIQDAFQLLVPVLQVGVLASSPSTD